MAEVTRILAIRHGETAWNVDNRIQGQLDVPLNDTGRWQAERLGEALADEDIAVVYSSDLARARQTAEAVAAAWRAPARRRAGAARAPLRHLRGPHLARDRGAAGPSRAGAGARRDPSFGPEGGEALQDFYARSVETALRLAAGHPGETIALVAHGGVMDCLYRAATRVGLQAPRSWQLGNASINRLLHTGEGFTLVGWADTGHLERGPRDELADGGASGAPAGQAA